MARRQSSPSTGKRSAGPAATWAGFSALEGAFATIPSTPPRHRAFEQHWGTQYAFSEAWRNLSVRCGSPAAEPWGGSRPPPAGRPRSPGKRTRREEHVLAHRPDEFRPAIPRSGWSPPEPVSASPACTDYHALPKWTLKTGTFYFAGKRNFLLCLDSGNWRNWRNWRNR